MMRIGLLGASKIAPTAVIEPAARRTDVRVLAVAARDPSRAARYAALHGIERALDDYAALVEAKDIDLIYCALPPSEHLEICLRALAAGKMLLIEKPFAMDALSARLIAGASAESGMAALEAFHYRFHTQFLDALEIVRSGVLGEITAASGHFHAQIQRGENELRWLAERGGGATMDLGCYVLHALRTLTSREPAIGQMSAELSDGIDVALRAHLDFDGVPARVSWSMAARREDALCLQGTEGSLWLHGFCAPHLGGSLTLVNARGAKRRPAATRPTYDDQLEHVVQVWRGACLPLTGGSDAVLNMEAIDACRAAAGCAIGG